MDTAVITGASRGLGLALARELARRDWRLVVDARGADELAAARAELAARTEVVAVRGDVADPEHRRALVAAGGPRIRLLVNNASVLGPSPQPQLADYPLAELERVYRVNVLAPLALFQAALPALDAAARARGAGRARGREVARGIARRTRALALPRPARSARAGRPARRQHLGDA